LRHYAQSAQSSRILSSRTQSSHLFRVLLVLEPRRGCLTTLLLITVYHIAQRTKLLSPVTAAGTILSVTLLLPLLLQILPQLTTLLHLLLHLLLPLILLIFIVLQNLRHSWACLFRVFPILPHCILYFRGRFVLLLLLRLLLRLLLSK
jgi:hypothetical protein